MPFYQHFFLGTVLAYACRIGKRREELLLTFYDSYEVVLLNHVLLLGMHLPAELYLTGKPVLCS